MLGCSYARFRAVFFGKSNCYRIFAALSAAARLRTDEPHPHAVSRIFVWQTSLVLSKLGRIMSPTAIANALISRPRRCELVQKSEF
jgi:hypothetical protein